MCDGEKEGKGSQEMQLSEREGVRVRANPRRSVEFGYKDYT